MLSSKVACIDLEGVLAPELWPFIAQQTGIASLSLTTREEPDYPDLMKRRIATLRAHGIKLSALQALIDKVEPLPGALEFLEVIERDYDVTILSDCFHELADGILSRLGSPIALCHRFVVDEAGFIVECAFAPRRGKEDIVNQFLAIGATVLAVGDAFNDIAMLERATYGFLVRPSFHTRAAAPHLRVVEELSEIAPAILVQRGAGPLVRASIARV